MTNEQPRKTYAEMTKEERDVEFRRLAMAELRRDGLTLVTDHVDNRHADPRFDRVVVPQRSRQLPPTRRRGRPSMFTEEMDEIIVRYQSPLDAYDALVEAGLIEPDKVTKLKVKGRYYYLMKSRLHEPEDT